MESGRAIPSDAWSDVGDFMSFSETISPLLGRTAFVWFHGSSAMDIFNRHMLLPRLMQVAALRLIAINCFSPLFSYHTEHGAVPLFGVTIVAATR